MPRRALNISKLQKRKGPILQSKLQGTKVAKASPVLVSIFAFVHGLLHGQNRVEGTTTAFRLRKFFFLGPIIII